ATIIITGVVDITPTLSATGPFTIPENIVDGGSVGTVTALDEEVDPGTYDTLTFSITTVEPPTNVFKINNSTGLITVTNNGEIDFETIDTYTLTVQVQDSGGFTDIEQVIVNISNIDEKPTVPGGQEFFVNENSTVFTSSNQVIATDPENDIVDYSITDPTDDLFFINNGSGELSVNILKADLLDFETQDTYVLTIEVSDAQGLTNANNITIKLNDINEPPIFNNFTTNIDENRPNGFSLSPFPYNISILKDPEGDDLDFKIVGGSGATAFSINENSGQITVGDATQLNFENTQSFSLIVEAKEASGTDLFSDTATITIDINNINEAPVINPNQAFNIPENSPNNTIVDTVIVDDEDEADDIENLNFAITNGNASSTFSIDNNGVIKVSNNSELDHEQNPSFTLEITVTDSNWDGQGTKQDVETITINLNDINESPVFNDFQTSINENRPNGFSLSPFPYDNTILMDPELDDLDFQIIGGTGSTAFTINENSGQIMVNDSTQLNYEDTQSFSLIVEAKEATGTDLFSDSSTITIDINNINEAPVINPNQLFNIQENSANNTRVDTVVFNDEDTADIGNLIFAITDGDSSGTFSIDNNGEIKVANNSALDFEQIQSFNLEITVTDSNWDSQGPKQDVETIIINVDNQNEQPTINSGQSFTIEGFSTNGTEVGTVIASDPDFGDTFEYEIIGGDDKGAFKIDSITGKITVNKRDELDFDKIQVFTLAVQVTDRLGKKSTNDVIINLTKPSTYFTFVPLLLNNYRVDEPNDNCAQAYGISTNQSLWFLPEDGEDWYKFTLTSSKSVEVVLSNYQAEGQIIAYQGSCGNLGNPPIGHNGDFSSTKTMNLGTLSAGTYFIRVVTDPPYGSTPYNLIINAQ
ncbi:MAG: cadherin repeat domain-containing protein, partial [Chloroflexi bacterium]